MSQLRTFLTFVLELSVIANLLLILANLSSLIAFGPLLENYDFLVTRASIHAVLTFLAAGMLAKYPLPLCTYLTARLEYAQARLLRDRRSPELVMD